MEQINTTITNETTETIKPSIYSLQLSALKEWLAENGEKPFRAEQIFDWLYKKRISSFEEMSNVSKGLREKLESAFVLTTLKTIIKQTSSDGTIKFLFEL
ncbi:MAG: 23S rRNA (adenine(2503)-C(2))-methyltransferase RlmN, partial [Bacillota bacterium]|nr:23S rRNA (adenine(2503)-C(2))-methyltransferase RlmN [Bacillota bacterium]